MRKMPRVAPASAPPSAPRERQATPERPAEAPAHQLDPVVARALFGVWSGDPAVVISSPPGAGKTRLVTHLARELTQRARLDVAVAAQTRAQALDVANRAAAVGADVVFLGRTRSRRPDGLGDAVHYAAGTRQITGRRHVTVATTARWQWTTQARNTADVLIVDEAWQMTWADLGALGAIAAQIVLVGDPGQIAPVVTAQARRWQHSPTGPHRPAPDALLAAYPDDDITQLRLPHTWRLGPDTTALIQPAFYPELPFTSMRPQTRIDLDGADLREIPAQVVDAGPHRCDPALVEAVVGRVHELLRSGKVATPDSTRPLTEADVAVVMPHVEQAALLAARLTDVPGVFVGTINQAQGLEREAVVILHPLAGCREATSFGVEPSRLCVALSRHRSHATLIVDSAARDLLRRARTADPANSCVQLQARILTQLCG
jgi:AAA domain